MCIQFPANISITCEGPSGTCCMLHGVHSLEAIQEEQADRM